LPTAHRPDGRDPKSEPCAFCAQRSWRISDLPTLRYETLPGRETSSCCPKAASLGGSSDQAVMDEEGCHHRKQSGISLACRLATLPCVDDAKKNCPSVISPDAALRGRDPQPHPGNRQIVHGKGKARRSGEGNRQPIPHGQPSPICAGRGAISTLRSGCA